VNLEEDWNDLRPSGTKVQPQKERSFWCRIGLHRWKFSSEGNTVISDCGRCKEHREEYVS